MEFETRFSSMLRGMVALRWNQFRWSFSEWAWLVGLKPSSGKWSERVSFIYIYALIIALMTPGFVNTLGSLYAAEAQTSWATQVNIIRNIIPSVIAVIGLLLVVVPWNSWTLRLTFGDITYLSPSPFDRRLLAVWRYVEMLLLVPLLIALPLILVVPMFGSIWARDVIPTVIRGIVGIGLWGAPLLALGWHISLRKYTQAPRSREIELITRLGIIGIAGVIALTNPEVLLWPGRFLVLVALDKIPWAWAFLIATLLMGAVIVWRAGRHLSLTRVSAASELSARIQNLGVMIVMDRRLLFSVLSQAHVNEGLAVGTLAPTRGLATVVARAALYYRRRSGRAIQIAFVGLIMSMVVIVWHPASIILIGLTAILLTLLIPPWLAHPFQQDQGVPFISQLIPQPLRGRVLVASIVPALLLLAGMLPVLLVFGNWMPNWVWGIVPLAWVMSLFGHVEAIGRGSAVGKRDIFSLLFGSLVVCMVIWSAMSSGATGFLALGPGIITGIGITVLLVTYASIRHSGFSGALTVSEPPRSAGVTK